MMRDLEVLQAISEAIANRVEEKLGRVEGTRQFCCDECGNVSRTAAGWKYLPGVDWTLCNSLEHVTRQLSPCVFAAGRLVEVRP